MSHLYMVMLGGRHARANTEVHDVVMAWGASLAEIIPQLKQAWFGEQAGLHIDAWAKIGSIESNEQHYQVQLSFEAPSVAEPRLYLINLGGYDARNFGELHRYVLVVANHAKMAKQQAKQYFEKHWQASHTDRVLDVDDCIAIDCVDGRYIHLVLAEKQESVWKNTYKVI